MAEWLITYRKDKDQSWPYERTFQVEAATVDSAISTLIAFNGKDCYVTNIKRITP